MASSDTTQSSSSLYSRAYSMADYVYQNMYGLGSPSQSNRGQQEEREQMLLETDGRGAQSGSRLSVSDYGSIDPSQETDSTGDPSEMSHGGADCEAADIGGDNDDEYEAVEALKESLLTKTKDFDLPVDPSKGYKATRLSIFSFRRPHMRAFHGSWMCFCCAWLLWFSMAPLLSTMRETSIDMTKADIWTSNLCALVGTIFVRIVLGPLCDEYGGKDTLVTLLAACAIPCGLAGLLIHDFASLLVVRSLIGCVGGTLVPAQFWVSCHFTPECSGVAMATAAGWGALGGGLAQVLMGSIIFPSLQYAFDGNDDLAWRVALSIPAVIAFCVACFFYHNSDDCPLGSYKEVRAAGLLQQKSAVDSFRQGIFNLNAWILFVQFGASLGIELVMESGMTMHLSERFGIPVARAAGLASLFGLMNIWARGFGGYISDRLHKMFSLRGRLFLQMALLLLEGLLILCFNQQGSSLNMTLFWMVSFAAAGQMGMGTCFGLIPYIDPRCTGTIAGIVAAGGNFGGVFLSNVFRTSASDAESFQVMANFCFVAALLTPLLVVSGYRGIVWGQEQTAAATLLTPAIASTRSS